ncbi:MAG: DNA polymerase III subunit gamma/tau, partial [Proteobacteria bacterium]|nr:DNA polymerase III subunit gamma/tau [Pseudomonadota bacterium]
EGVPGEPAALKQLAKAAAGSMRDALSLLDQAIAHGAGKVEEANVRDMLGTVGDDYLFSVLDALTTGDVRALLAVADVMNTRSLSFDAALQDLATLFHRVALAQFAPQALADDGERQRLLPYAAAFDAEFLQLAYQITIHGRDDLALAPDERAGFSMTLLRLHTFRPDTPGPLGESVPKKEAQPTPPASSPPPANPREVATSKAPTLPPLATAPGNEQHDWHEITARLNLGGMVRGLAQHCELAEVGTDMICLRLPPAHKYLLGKAHQDKLQAELQTYYGRPLKLNIVLADTAVETPVERSRLLQRERQERAIAAIEQDSFVREVVELFDATINESSIKPIN